jgi:hypothetical protein
MQNAHLRLGQLEYLRSTTTIQTRVRLHMSTVLSENTNKDTCSASMEEMRRLARLRPLFTRGIRFS